MKKNSSTSRKKSQARRKAAKKARRRKRKGQGDNANESARRQLQGRGFDMSRLRALASRSTSAASLREDASDREFDGAGLIGTAVGADKDDEGGE